MAYAAAPFLARDDLLLEEEIARIWRSRSTMSPATLTVVCSVLESILNDAALDPGVAGSAEALLANLLEQPRSPGRRGRVAWAADPVYSRLDVKVGRFRRDPA